MLYNKFPNSKLHHRKRTMEQQNKRIVQMEEQAMGGLRSFWKRTPHETKEEYRQLFLPADISQAKLVILLFAVILSLFTISDYIFFGLSTIFYGVVSLRLGLIFYSLYQLRYISRVKNYRSYDRATFIYLLVLVIGTLIANSTGPQNFLSHIIINDVAVFVFYLVIPTRFIYQALPSVIFTIGGLFMIMLSFKSFGMIGFATAFFSLIAANIIAALSSVQFHSYRWRIFQNMVERKENERLVAIGQTAGMVGHDIRNPLQAIISELYISKEAIANAPDMAEEYKKEALASINLIEEQADYINKIVSDLQDYARPINLEYSEIALSDLFARVFHAVSIPDNVVLKIDVKDCLTIKTDPNLVRRALTNLVNNGIQSMPDGGTLGLTAYINNGKVVITVSDTGIGIPEEIRPKLFNPLFTTKSKGQGLGLVVVKRLVEALGGSITFESEVGKGTTFTVCLPTQE